MFTTLAAATLPAGHGSGWATRPQRAPRASCRSLRFPKPGLFCEVRDYPVQGGYLSVGEFVGSQVRSWHLQMGRGSERRMVRTPAQRDMCAVNLNQSLDLCQLGTDVIRQDRVWSLRKLFEDHFHCRFQLVVPCRSHGVSVLRSPGRDGHEFVSQANRQGGNAFRFANALSKAAIGLSPTSSARRSGPGTSRWTVARKGG